MTLLQTIVSLIVFCVVCNLLGSFLVYISNWDTRRKYKRYEQWYRNL